MNQNHMRTFIFGSEWHFLPEGVKKVSTEFDRRVKRREWTATIVYREFNHTFKVDCGQQSLAICVEVQKIFLKIFRDTIRQEGDNAEEDDDTSGSDDGKGGSAKDQKQKSKLICKVNEWLEAKSKIAQSWSSVYPEELRPFKFKEIWTCENESNSMEGIVPLHCHELISSLTGAKLMEDPNAQRILIGANDKKSIHRTVHKLDTMKKYFFMQALPAGHVFYSEEHQDFEVALKPLLDVKKKLVETTLLDPIRRPRIKDLSVKAMLATRFLTARCCVMNPRSRTYVLKSGKKLIPATQEDYLNSPEKLWVGYQYPGRDGSSLDVMIEPHPDIEEKDANHRGPVMPLVDKAESIRIWQKNIPQVVETMKQMIYDSTHGSTREVSHNNNKEQRVGRLINDQHECLKTGHTSGPFVALQPPLHNSSPITADCGALISISDQPDRLPSLPQLEKAILFSRATTHSALVSSMVPSASGRQQQSKLDTHKYNGNVRQSAAEKPSGQNQNLASTVPPNTPVSGLWVPTHEPSEDPTEDFLKDTKIKLDTILAILRNFEGEVSVEAKLGRILIRKPPRNAFVLGDLGNPSDPAQMDEQILRLKIRSDFTELLTAVPADIEFMISMTDNSGHNLWKAESVFWSVVYKIECLDREKNTTFVVEIDAENFETRIKSFPHSYGKLFVNCTLRNWDFCINANGVLNLEEIYGEVGKDILKTLHIPNGQARITSMTFQISHKHNITVTSIRILRNKKYLSVNEASILNLTEVNDLFIDGQSMEPEPGDCGGYAQYHGFTNDQHRIHPGSLWFEAGVESVIAREYFKENLKLEFGEEVGWTLDSMHSKNVLEAVYRPACEMIKQMDGIGFWNDKYSDAEPELPRTPEETPQMQEQNNGKQKEVRLTPRDNRYW